MSKRATITVFSARYRDPKEIHHPEPGCPERKRIESDGNGRCREVADPRGSVLAFDLDKRGKRTARLLDECRTCRSLSTLRRRMTTDAHSCSDTARADNRRGRSR